MSKSSEAGKIEILKEYALIYLSQLSIIYEVVNQLPSLILRFEEDILCWKSYKEGRLSISWRLIEEIEEITNLEPHES
ncbi:uncharacterized protein OCT59_001397 [Rhizophagus irregularis]|uniref:uncharacterized protein n=1 Tax=Rhizophagus irregularis TaxID=588596 RepID=UPI00333033BE|nr:hypothetical protein OCT59_001397 [Rhizophagus irregularis]